MWSNLEAGASCTVVYSGDKRLVVVVDINVCWSDTKLWSDRTVFVSLVIDAHVVVSISLIRRHQSWWAGDDSRQTTLTLQQHHSALCLLYSSQCILPINFRICWFYFRIFTDRLFLEQLVTYLLTLFTFKRKHNKYISIVTGNVQIGHMIADILLLILITF